MTSLTIVLSGICVVAVIVMIIMIKKQKRVFAAVLGFVAAGLIATITLLSVIGKPLTYLDQTKESYLAMQEDKDVSSFRIVVDNVITDKFPEWDDEHPFSYFVDYRISEIRITTNETTDTP